MGQVFSLAIAGQLIPSLESSLHLTHIIKLLSNSGDYIMDGGKANERGYLSTISTTNAIKITAKITPT